jgi:hypothetical protein
VKIILLHLEQTDDHLHWSTGLFPHQPASEGDLVGLAGPALSAEEQAVTQPPT